MKGRLPGRYFRCTRYERSLKKGVDTEWLTEKRIREYAEFYFHHRRPSCACRGLYDLVYHTRTGVVASKSFVFSTDDANEFAETDTKLVPGAFSRTNAGRSHRRRLSTSSYLSMSSATQCLAASSSNKSNDEISAICFLSTPTIQKDSHRSVWKQFHDEKPLQPQESALYIPWFFSLT